MDAELNKVAQRAELLFHDRFKAVPQLDVSVPGRVNLIGDHTDYNDGFALPMAVDRYMHFAAARLAGDTCLLFSDAIGEAATLNIDRPETHPQGWQRFAAGVLHLAQESLGRLPGFDAVVTSGIPKGAGLSSSAAFAIGLTGVAEQLAGKELTQLEKARLCQQAEHEYAGVPCGIMDQLAILNGLPDHACLLDCRNLEVSPVPIPSTEVAVIVIDTGVERELSKGVYADRRSSCKCAAEVLGIRTLRDLTLTDLQSARKALDDESYKRALHVVTENHRVQEFASRARESDWESAGRLMRESHVSLRENYEVTIPELDLLADEAEVMGGTGGVFGCRMTGGGFGGCVVAIVKPEKLESVSARLAKQFDRVFGRLPTVHQVRGVG